jgi:hypothetical protein
MNFLDELVCMKLKENCLILEVTSVAEDIEALTMWDTQDVFSDKPEKYIAEALDPIVKFQKYKTFKYTTIRELYLILQSTMTLASNVNLPRKLINELCLSAWAGSPSLLGPVHCLKSTSEFCDANEVFPCR